MILFANQKHKILIFCVALLSGALGFFIEYTYINDGLWTWANSGSAILGVPYIVTVTYFMGGLIAASLVVSPKSKELIKKAGNKIFLVLVPIGIVYAIFTKDLAFLILALAVFFYSMLNKDSYILKISTIFATVDLVAENVLIYLGYLTYTYGYNGAIYLGFFVSVILIMSLTSFILKKGRLKIL